MSFFLKAEAPKQHQQKLQHQHKQQKTQVSGQEYKKLQLGVEAFSPALLYRIADKKAPIAVGIITNQTGKDQSGKRTVDILQRKGFLVKRIFAPEHGIDGCMAAEKEVKDTIDVQTKAPIISLFGKGTGKAIGARIIKDLDLIIFDMQDSGMRHYTYISTLFHVVQAAARHKKPLIIFDRPNPLKQYMEGPLVESRLTSFISVAPIPLRHGMTIGELAHYFNNHHTKKPAKLHIVKMRNFDRTQGLPGALPAPLSPYIKNKLACYGYSFLGLLGEIKPFDTGLNTSYAMQCIALPAGGILDKKWGELAEKLKLLGVATAPMRYKSPRKKRWCTGLRLVLSDQALFSSCEVLLAILTFFQNSGVKLTFSDYFDKAVGTSKIREYIQGKISRLDLAREINTQLEHFFAKAKESFLYTPVPKLVKLNEKEI